MKFSDNRYKFQVVFVNTLLTTAQIELNSELKSTSCIKMLVSVMQQIYWVKYVRM